MMNEYHLRQFLFLSLLSFLNKWRLCKCINAYVNCSSVSSRNDWINILKIRSSPFYSTYLSKHTTIASDVGFFFFVHRHISTYKAVRNFHKMMQWHRRKEGSNKEKKMLSLGSAACICRHYRRSTNIIDYLSWKLDMYICMHTSDR
jgi:hypothetical protein